MPEWSMVSSIMNLALAVAVFYFARKKDTRDDTAETTSLIVKLESIAQDVTEIKIDMRELREERQKDHDAIIRLSESIKAIEQKQETMWERIDELKER